MLLLLLQLLLLLNFDSYKNWLLFSFWIWNSWFQVIFALWQAWFGLRPLRLLERFFAVEALLANSQWSVHVCLCVPVWLVV